MKITGNPRVEIVPFVMTVPVANRNSSKRRQQVRTVHVQKNGRLIRYHSRKWRHNLSSEDRSTIDQHQLQELEAGMFFGNCIEQVGAYLKIVKPDVTQVENVGQSILQGWSDRQDEYEMISTQDVFQVFLETTLSPLSNSIVSSSTCLCPRCVSDPTKSNCGRKGGVGEAILG